jgi:hypothetical protein
MAHFVAAVSYAKEAALYTKWLQSMASYVNKK